MKKVIKTVYVSDNGREYDTPKGALINDFESLSYDMIKEFCEEDSYIRQHHIIITGFLREAAAHPARFARRLRRLHKMRQALIEYEQAEAKQPDAIPF